MKYLEDIQEKLSRKLILEDKFENIDVIGGASSISFKNIVISGIVVCSFPDIKILERAHSEIKTSFPYISGFLTFREGPPIISAYKKLKKKPDVLILNCSGICHPRHLGMASHLGILINVPTIGVTKRLLCGYVKDDKIIYMGKQVGWKLKNIYISPGHMVSLKTSLEIIKNSMRNHRLPEPLYLARKYLR